MNPTRALPKVIFTLVMLGIVSYCTAVQDYVLLLIMSGVAVASWLLTEWPMRRPLPNWVTNIAALLVLGWVGMQVASYGLELVNAAGRMTIAVQLVVLFRRKTNREYGQLLVLSVVQTAATSVISVSIFFALTLIAYFVLGMLALLMFQLKASHDDVLRENQAARRADAAAGPFQGALQRAVGRGHRRHFRLTVMSIALVCVLVSLIVFIAVPRRDTGEDNAGRRGLATQQIGFSEEVSLTGAGIGAGSPRVVLHISVTEDGEPVGSAHQPMLVRGTSLDTYDVVRHIWQRSESVSAHDRRRRFVPDFRANDDVNNPPIDLAYTPETPPAREAKITMFDSDPDVLFTLYPGSLEFESDHAITMRFNAIDQRLTASTARDEIVYRLRMPRSPLPGMQAYHYDALHGADSSFGSVRREVPGDREPPSYARQWYVQPQRVRDLAQQILEPHGLSRDVNRAHTEQDRRMAQILADYLASNFEYSLSNPSSSSETDPIIAFLFDHQSGHCELFASAHVALCRSIGIPARVITGYRASEYDEYDEHYVVRERNAHAWTEVHGGPGVGWRKFDPSPAAPVETEHAQASGFWEQARALYNYLEHGWASTVVAFAPEDRAQLIAAIRRFLIDRPTDAIVWLGQALGLVDGATAIHRFGRLAYLLIGVVALALALGLGRVTARLIVRRRRAKALHLNDLPRREHRDLLRHIEFYFRMTRLLKKAGYRRPAWQTPRGFAHELAEANPLRFDPVLALTETFYEVRFGGRTIDDTRQQQIEAHLKQLKHSLNGARG